LREGGIDRTTIFPSFEKGAEVGAITTLGYGDMQLNRTDRLLYARIEKIRTMYLLIRPKSIGESKVLPP
jgi:hypothetical protein